MGMHTWFIKDHNEYTQWSKNIGKIEDNILEQDLEEKLPKHLVEWYDKLEQTMCDDFHDVFRTNKCEPDGEYCTDIITSEKQCFEWINDPKNEVYDVNEHTIPLLKEFWKKYPNGSIHFG